MAYFFSPFSSFFSSPFLLLSSRCNPRGKKRKGTQPCLGKLVRKLGDFSFLLVQEPELEPRNSPPCIKLSDLPCSAPHRPAAPALWV
ncbi:hypothetical protein SLEP1_g9719 [Rubroshorea leprosula]|uniref:Secreted protein n=1 Tax=Rubroshorea leprosula TaxID=152421 RepID=A0AAV5IGT3_9ROSI|nr:hypothetical protein SLEP1_g9719 [Rubroshorea leprosula]